MEDLFCGLMAPWQNAQRPMTQVIRWGNFPSYGQTLVEHNNSIQFVLLWVEARLHSRTNIDWALLGKACLVHDHGEPLSGGDEHAGNKTDGKELREYHAFVRLIADAEKGFRDRLLFAFLLQYVRKPQWWEYFTVEHRQMIEELSQFRSTEALLFEAVERLDYLASATEGCRRGIKNDTETMIDHVLRNQVPKLDLLADEYHPFARSVWTSELRSSFLALGSV